MSNIGFGIEMGKWLYGLVVCGMCFLFFSLFLDGFCFLIIGGWNPLLGDWPIFSGTLGTLFYGNWYVTIPLVLGFSAVARLIIWDRVPTLLEFGVKHDS